MNSRRIIICTIFYFTCTVVCNWHISRHLDPAMEKMVLSDRTAVSRSARSEIVCVWKDKEWKKVFFFVFNNAFWIYGIHVQQQNFQKNTQNTQVNHCITKLSKVIKKLTHKVKIFWEGHFKNSKIPPNFRKKNILETDQTWKKNFGFKILKVDT